ncbi:MAG: gliding motility-associated C-terminal domain-containing protein [Bacteroidales bacterium]|nr:gliding motility-associated C-terminal domain-containing protein [Bacteroidales bacterium]
MNAQIVPNDTITITICKGEFYLENGFAIIGQEAGFHTYIEHFTAADGSDSSVLLQVTVLTEKLINLGDDRSVCEASEFPMVLDAGAGFNSYLWSTGDISQTINVTKPGTYSVVGNYGVNCTATSSVTIESHALSAYLSYEPIDFCENYTTTFHVESNDPTATFSWNTGDITEDLTVQQYGTYTAYATNGTCTASASMTIDECPFLVYFPNAFTPFYQDGINDFFELIGTKEAIAAFNIVICDRWGKQVFYSNDVNFKWDGMVNSEYAINQVFRYAVKLQTYQGKKYVYKGAVTVL